MPENQEFQLPINKSLLFDLISNFNTSVEKFKQIEIKVHNLEKIVQGNPDTDKPGLLEIVRSLSKEITEVSSIIEKNLIVDIQNIKDNLTLFNMSTTNKVEGLTKETSGLNSKLSNLEELNIRLLKVEDYVTLVTTRPNRMLIWVPLLALLVSVLVQIGIPIFKLIFMPY